MKSPMPASISPEAVRILRQSIHDGLGQQLFAIQLMAKLLADDLHARQAPEAEAATRLLEALSEEARLLGEFRKQITALALPVE